MSRILDGAGISLNRQMDMLRFILRNNKKGVRVGEIQFHMRARHGVSTQWVEKYLKQWAGWGVVTQQGTKLHINEEKWRLLQQTRNEGFDVEEV